MTIRAMQAYRKALLSASFLVLSFLMVHVQPLQAAPISGDILVQTTLTGTSTFSQSPQIRVNQYDANAVNGVGALVGTYDISLVTNNVTITVPDPNIFYIVTQLAAPTHYSLIPMTTTPTNNTNCPMTSSFVTTANPSSGATCEFAYSYSDPGPPPVTFPVEFAVYTSNTHGGTRDALIDFSYSSVLLGPLLLLDQYLLDQFFAIDGSNYTSYGLLDPSFVLYPSNPSPGVSGYSTTLTYGAIRAGTLEHFSAPAPWSGYVRTFVGCNTSGNMILTGSGDHCYALYSDLPATLTVATNVVGGGATASDFNLHVNGVNPSTANFTGQTSGLMINLDAGAYSVTSSALANYTTSYSSGCTGTFVVGATATCTVTQTYVGQPITDLRITNAASPTSTSLGNVVTYTLTVSNQSVTTATQAFATDILPMNLAYVSSTATLGSYSSSNGVWTIGDLAASQVETLTLRALVNGGSSSTISNTASVSSTNPDGDTADNQATSTLAVSAQADMAVSLAADSSSPLQNADVVYTLNVSNAGPNDAQGVSATTTLLSGLTLVSSSPNVGSYSTSTGVWSIGALASGQTAVMTMTVKMSGVSAGATVVNSATVTSTTLDANTSNNQASASLVIASPQTNSSGGGGCGGICNPYNSSQAPVTTYQSLTTIAGLPQVDKNVKNLESLGVTSSSLVKLADDKNPLTQEDSAVYYIGADGQRHAFPNAKVYFTWYPNFSDVRVVSSSALASIPLGKNMTYKPGVKLVKFLTESRVYAVEKGPLLRWISSEDVAKASFGDAWSSKVDDIADTFYRDYKIGASFVQGTNLNWDGQPF